jgi:hypothetical protein
MKDIININFPINKYWICNLSVFKYITYANEPTVILILFSCGFLYPKNDFNLIFMNTIGYFSDNMFYRINLENGQS